MHAVAGDRFDGHLAGAADAAHLGAIEGRGELGEVVSDEGQGPIPSCPASSAGTTSAPRSTATCAARRSWRSRSNRATGMLPRSPSAPPPMTALQTQGRRARCARHLRRSQLHEAGQAFGWRRRSDQPAPDGVTRQGAPPAAPRDREAMRRRRPSSRRDGAPRRVGPGTAHPLSRSRAPAVRSRCRGVSAARTLVLRPPSPPATRACRDKGYASASRFTTIPT